MQPKKISGLRFIILINLLFLASTSMAFQLELDTSSWRGASVLVTYDLIDGAPGTSKIKIDAPKVDGIPIGSTMFLEDLLFFNTTDQLVTLGDKLILSFFLEEGAIPALGFFPDSFSAFLLDSIGLPLFLTSDPTGADSLLQWDIGTGDPIAYVGILSSVPEPSQLILILVALATLFLYRVSRLFYVVVGLIFVSASASAAPSLATSTDLGAQTQITVSGLRFNRRTNTFDSIVTILNTSQAAINKPFSVAVLSLPHNVILSNATVISDEAIPLIVLEGNDSLIPGGKISLILKFVNHSNQSFPISLRLTRLEQPIPTLALLQGPDADGNGVRDDLEPILHTRYTDIAQRNAAVQVLKNMRNSFAATGSVVSAFSAVLSLNKAFDCMFSLIEHNQAEIEISFLRDEMINTRERITTWITLADLISGQSVPVDISNACES